MPKEIPFECVRCKNQPMEHFALYTKTNDWLTAYPADNLLHIHFGESTHTNEDSLAEANFHWTWLEDVVKKYPNKKWFFVTDFTRKDDSEFLTDDAQDIYKKIRKHPRLGGGAMYGVTYAMRMLVNLLFLLGGSKTEVVHTSDEAEAAYQKWRVKNLVG